MYNSQSIPFCELLYIYLSSIIFPKVVGTIGGSSSWNGTDHGICSVGANSRKIILPKILALSS